jgi:hypothetical protein
LGYDEDDNRSILEIASAFSDELDDLVSLPKGRKPIGPRNRLERNRDSAQLRDIEKQLDALTSPWALYAFSDGHRLEDREDLKSYNITPHSLLEIHRVGAYVTLPRNHHYILPFYREDVIVAWIHLPSMSQSPDPYADKKKALNSSASVSKQKWTWATVRISDGYLEVYELGAGWGYGCASSDAAFKIWDQTGSYQQDYPFHSPWKPAGPSTPSDFTEQSALERKRMFGLRLDDLFELGDGPGRTQAGIPPGNGNCKVVFARFLESDANGNAQEATYEADIAFAFPVANEGESRDTGE